MGDQNVTTVKSQDELQHFVRCLIKDTQAMERMLKEDWFETDPIRIGAEQEMCLIDKNWRPIHVNLEALKIIDNPMFTSELANFNLEANLLPLEFKDRCFSEMHEALRTTLDEAQKAVDKLGATILLTGILPTIRKVDVEIANITPLERYRALMDALAQLRGEAFELRLTGIDELSFKQNTAMLEACNTSFQVHLQVNPDDFPRLYNYAQALAGPVMSVAVNSPMLFGRRLWQETRIALFQQSIDIRTLTEHFRERSPRVTFGSDWVRSSVMEIYREDIARFQVLLTSEIDEDAFETMAKGIAPKLRALQIHNSTVYRWNRPCYGISDNGKPHLRIENRILPAGPSLPDAIANAALWIGLMNGLDEAYPDISKVMDFSDAKYNFFAAARFGMDTHFNWAHGKKISPRELMQKELLPLARIGLEKASIAKEDIDSYLGIIEERVDSSMTGSNWMLKSYSKLQKENVTRDEIASAITASIYREQHKGIPVHKWELASVEKMDYIPTTLLVEEFMNTDIITVRENDVLDLPANLMDWRHLRHLPVEDDEGKLVGLITSRMLLRYLIHHQGSAMEEKLPLVKDLMRKNPVYVSTEDNIITAMERLRAHRIGCLPVLKNDILVGMITEAEFLNITSNLVKRLARKHSLREALHEFKVDEQIASAKHKGDVEGEDKDNP